MAAHSGGDDTVRVLDPATGAVLREVGQNKSQTKARIFEIPVQGGLDPKILLGSVKELQKGITKYISAFSNYPYIFNLGHGVLPETKPETIDFIVKFIREKND